MRPRLAPSERRTAISRWRATARASITLDTLAHPASSTSANAAKTGDSSESSLSESVVGLSCGRTSAQAWRSRPAASTTSGVIALCACCEVTPGWRRTLTSMPRHSSFSRSGTARAT